MSTLALSLAMFCLPSPVEINDAGQSVPNPPPKADDQFCLYLTEPNGSGGYRWRSMAEYCSGNKDSVCAYACTHYGSYYRRDCGCMPLAANEYTICPPKYTPNQMPPQQVACLPCDPPLYKFVACPVVYVCPQPCERPRLFARLRCR